MSNTRVEVSPENRWNIESLYADLSEWRKAFQAFIKDPQQKPRWPSLAKNKGKLDQGPEKVKKTFEELVVIDRALTKLLTYIQLRHNEDIANPEVKEALGETLILANDLAQETAWIHTELLAFPEELYQKYKSDPVLADFSIYMEKIYRFKKHSLSLENEVLLAQADLPLQATFKTFSAINDADFNFGLILDSQGSERQLTSSNYKLYIHDRDRLLRERTFKQYHGLYLSFENTLCELLSGLVQNHIFQMRARNYRSCLDASLFYNNIPTSVYHALIKAVNSRLSSYQRYMELRKRVLKVNELHFYDLFVPLTPEVDINMPYNEAVEVIIDSVAPLGSQYQNNLAKGLKKDRWVDRYENLNKHSGAFSGGCYDSMPFIMVNYNAILKDVFTLAHEAGHSMHSLHSWKHQPYQYCDYPIFVAEVASTFNEDLLTRSLLKKCTDKATRIYLINQKIEDICATLFRQTMFAEFELFIHDQAEKGTPLTPQLLKKEYGVLNQKYFGSTIYPDEEIEIEWARIPHFYYNFYVFQYATGLSASLYLSEKVVSGGEKDREDYLRFLEGGSSKYPIDLLKIAGVDMESPLPVFSAIDRFDNYLAELEELLK